MSPDEETRSKALEKCKASLQLADEMGARCCVNIAGSRGEKWDGPCAEDLTPETFDCIVETVRDIIDTVRPTRTFYTLETMPWMYPNSADSYARLLKCIDRKAAAVHFDPVNLVCSPDKFFSNGEMIRDFVSKLGPQIRSCHAKDIALQPNLTTHLDEVRPGLGNLDYSAFLKSVEAVDPDIPLIMEHLSDQDEYALAAEHIRSVAKAEGVTL